MELVIQVNLHMRPSRFGCVMPFVSLIQSCWRILWSAIKLKRINWYLLNFWHRNNHQGKVVFKTTTLGFGQLCFWANKIPGFFCHQYVWKKSIDTFVWPLTIFFVYFLYFLSNVLGPFSYGLFSSQFQTNFPFQDPLKTTESFWFLDVFRGYG